MPLARYFLYVGGVLLALLFIVDACLPKAPALAAKIAQLPSIRIYASENWPERIVFDTSAPMIDVTQIANSEIPDRPAPAPSALPPVVGEALAQMRQADAPQSSKPARQPQRKMARRQLARPVLLATRRSPYSWFGPPIW